MQNYQILVCEDEVEIGNAIEIYLKNQGTAFIAPITGRKGWRSWPVRRFIWRSSI